MWNGRRPSTGSCWTGWPPAVRRDNSNVSAVAGAAGLSSGACGGSERRTCRGTRPMTAETLTVRCAIAGGGPAGMMLGFLLARAGVEVVVLEKHADFLRDFRGDTIHPSTLELMHELGLLEEFLPLPHQEGSATNAQIGAASIP